MFECVCVVISFRLEQADLTLVVVDCALLPSNAPEAAEFLSRHLKSVLSLQEHPETGMTNHMGVTANPICPKDIQVVFRDSLVPAGRVLLVLNKTDLLPHVQRQDLDRELGRLPGLPPVCLLSCHTDEGLQDFLAVLHSSVRNL